MKKRKLPTPDLERPQEDWWNEYCTDLKRYVGQVWYSFTCIKCGAPQYYFCYRSMRHKLCPERVFYWKRKGSPRDAKRDSAKQLSPLEIAMLKAAYGDA